MTNTDTSRPLPFEDSCARALDELRNSPEISVSEAKFTPASKIQSDQARVFENLAKHKELPFSPAVQNYFFRFKEIEAYWRSSRPDSGIVGELNLSHLYRSVTQNGLHYTWEGTDDEERELHRELKIFDDTPRTGSGRMATLRATPGTTDPEIWFFDMRQGAMEMDLDYGTYLDTLLITKGTIGWQFLFCDAGYGDPGFTPIADGLKEMLEVFPRLFPDYDYSDLRARLEERM